jgi:hypothetical protein
MHWLTLSDSRPAFFGILALFDGGVHLVPVDQPRVGACDIAQTRPTSEWPTIRQARSLGKVNWTASVLSDPERPIKARDTQRSRWSAQLVQAGRRQGRAGTAKAVPHRPSLQSGISQFAQAGARRLAPGMGYPAVFAIPQRCETRLGVY